MQYPISSYRLIPHFLGQSLHSSYSVYLIYTSPYNTKVGTDYRADVTFNLNYGATVVDSAGVVSAGVVSAGVVSAGVVSAGVVSAGVVSGAVVSSYWESSSLISSYVVTSLVVSS
ncbi:MAG: hypothetical protein II653_02355 [Lachnospiraceae bacterium]|nr:hypothetical protein [Lachnospiraceae bacterium]MBQ5474446.1 hypothetical protein [Lachnospiraceae bacterium]